MYSFRNGSLVAMYDVILNSEVGAEVDITRVQAAVVVSLQSEGVGDQLGVDVSFTPQIKGLYYCYYFEFVCLFVP